VIEMVRRDGARAAVAMMLGTLAKYALLVLVPLQFALRRGRKIAWEAALGVGLLIVSLLVMGTEPYRIFMKEIVPTLGRTSAIGENSALYAFFLRVQRIDSEFGMPRAMEIGFRLLQIASIILILSLVLLRRRAFWERADRVFAAAAALFAWLLIFSPIFWEHYHAYLAPFWGWLAFEATRSRVRAVLAALVLAMAYLPSSLLVQQLHLHRLPEPLFSHLLWSTVLLMFMAIDRLLRDRSAAPQAVLS